MKLDNNEVIAVLHAADEQCDVGDRVGLQNELLKV